MYLYCMVIFDSIGYIYSGVDYLDQMVFLFLVFTENSLHVKNL
jgi:hypothetical protein